MVHPIRRRARVQVACNHLARRPVSVLLIAVLCAGCGGSGGVPFFVALDRTNPQGNAAPPPDGQPFVTLQWFEQNVDLDLSVTAHPDETRFLPDSDAVVGPATETTRLGAGFTAAVGARVVAFKVEDDARWHVTVTDQGGDKAELIDGSFIREMRQLDFGNINPPELQAGRFTKSFRIVGINFPEPRYHRVRRGEEICGDLVYAGATGPVTSIDVADEHCNRVDGSNEDLHCEFQRTIPVTQGSVDNSVNYCFQCPDQPSSLLTIWRSFSLSDSNGIASTSLAHLFQCEAPSLP